MALLLFELADGVGTDAMGWDGGQLAAAREGEQKERGSEALNVMGGSQHACGQLQWTKQPAIDGDGDGWVSGHWQCLPCRASLSADHPVPTFSTANCRGVQPGESVHEKIAHRFFTWHKARNPAVLGWDTARQLQAHRRADAAIGGPVYTVRYTRPRTGTSPRLPRRAGWRAGRPQESGSHRLATASSRPPSLRSLAEPVGQWPLPICWFRRRVCGEQARQGR